MQLYARIFMMVLMLSSCGNAQEPIPSEVAHAKPVSNHTLVVQSYDIPRGIFRGVLWPSQTDKSFQIWVIDGDKELFWDIPAPPAFVNDLKEVTEAWEFTVIETSKKTITYLAERKDKTVSMRLQLPVKKRTYSFSVLMNASSQAMLVFMDIAEDIVDTGIFGYVVINNKL